MFDKILSLPLQLANIFWKSSVLDVSLLKFLPIFTKSFTLDVSQGFENTSANRNAISG